MIYKITITKTRGFNTDKAEVGMNVEISSCKLSSTFTSNINKVNLRYNPDAAAILEAFKAKYGIDLQNEGLLSSFSADQYFKCEAL